MNTDEIKKLSEAALRMLEEQQTRQEMKPEGMPQEQWDRAMLIAKSVDDIVEEQRLADEQTKEIVEMMQVTPAEVLTLSDEDFEKMMNVLENPPEPSEKLKEAFRKHSEHVVKKEGSL
jgi:membrane-bound lytic murein transglycosylase B